MTTAISQCPFCASDHVRTMEVEAEGWAVVCDTCGAIGPVRQGESDSVESWNMRLTPGCGLGLQPAATAGAFET